MSSEAEELLAEIEQRRGYVHEYHRVLADQDPAFLRAYEAFLAAAYTDQRKLSRREKELVFIGVLTALGAEHSHIRAHIDAATKVGVENAEILEVLELCLPPCGVPRFMNAFTVFSDALGEQAREDRD
jgi:4-carboxymuconolactone decarboxylase